MAAQHILLVEDDEDIQQLVSYNLLKAGFQVACATSGEEALQMIRQSQRPDLVLLDLMLPGLDGLEVCRFLKEQASTRDLPVVMLTARGEEADVVAGLELGADDYITKPFSPKVVVARVKAVLRRRARESAKPAAEGREVLAVRELLIHPGRHEVTVQGETVPLTCTEFGILSLLAKRPGWVFTRQQIIDAVRGHGYLVTSRAVDVQIFGLRKKLGESGHLIETVRGIGYRLQE